MKLPEKRASKFSIINKRRLLVAAVFGIGLSLFVAVPLTTAQKTQDKIIYRVQMAGLPLGGKTKEEARTILKEQAELFKDGVDFQYGDQKQKIKNFLALDEDATLNKAFSFGHNQGLIKDSFVQMKTLATGEEITPVWHLDQPALTQEINNVFAPLLKTPANAAFAVVFDENNAPQINIKPEQNGLIFDEAAIIDELTQRLNNFSSEPVALKTLFQTPTITSSELEPLKSSVADLLKRKEMVLVWEKKQWTIKQNELASWVDVTKENGETKISLNQAKAELFLKKIAAEVDRPPTKPVFEINEARTRAVKFAPAAPGEKILMEKNLKIIEQEFLNSIRQPADEKNYQAVSLMTIKTWPETQTGETNQFSIKELVSTGRTNFSGSPNNRVKNIRRGAEILNGLLIAPDEEFSLLSNLRPFTEENGYFKELVIKAAEGRTVPEIGGGLCQIGTTAFRVALNAGLPITARHNHSYRVSYYEPPVGMDATIYDPAPDFKFINDTNNYLLLRTRLDGFDLIFELWGTLDGRTIDISKPIISNIIKPPAKKIIETLNLKPGATKCTEKAHIGSDASFVYKVSYLDGQIKEKEFKSRYRPWQEVCLLGVKELTPPPEENVPIQPTEPSDQTKSDLDNFGTPIAPD
ncbi:MAG: VanW family protein [bacterium]|nr:VanW family protein [bacterium]